MRVRRYDFASRRSPCFAALAVLAAAALLALPAGAVALPAPTLFETTGGNGEAANPAPAPPSDLYTVNPANGAATSVGSTGYAITGLAQDPTTGVLYGVSNNKSPIAKLTLLTINPANGAATPVGSLGAHTIADISFNSQGQLFGWDEKADDLASIDKATGAVTVIPSPIGTDGSGSSFDRNDVFWQFGGNEDGPYYTIDTATGAATERGTLKPFDGAQSGISAAAWDCPRSTLYAAVNNNNTDPTVPASHLVTIDVNAGTLTDKGATVTNADGLEWFCPLAFEITGAGATVGPGATQTLSLPLVRGPRIKGAATVAYATQNGSAQAGRDFTAISGTASFANNVAEQALGLTVTPDPKAGQTRSFQVVLSNPSSGGTVGKPFTVTIKTAKPKLKVGGPRRIGSGIGIVLRSNETPVKFRCKLDRGKFKACGKNGKKGKKLTLSSLDAGPHTLIVQAVNGDGLKSKMVKKSFAVLG